MPKQEVLNADVIRYTRKAMLMTQVEFANYLGVEENTVGRWERGVHLPVGRKARTIRLDYRRVKRNEARYGEPEEQAAVGGPAAALANGTVREDVAGAPDEDEAAQHPIRIAQQLADTMGESLDYWYEQEVRTHEAHRD